LLRRLRIGAGMAESKQENRQWNAEALR